MSNKIENFVRQNDSSKAEIDFSRFYATGAFKIVYKGKYIEGERSGQQCVSKIFKANSVFEESYFDKELKVVAKALEIINSFNKDNIINRNIFLNEPTIWYFKDSKELNLVEPMIENFEKFNSNSGWTPDQTSPWIEVMQALSHYSYHKSNRSFLICDLQGGSYKDGFILTDPVITSTTREYGPTDLGPEGISTFFARHKCNKYCNSQWMTPIDKKMYFNPQKSTSMMLPTRNSRPTMPN